MQQDFVINGGGESEAYVGELFAAAKSRVVCIGVSFYRTIKLHKDIILRQLAKGVKFEFCFLSRIADFPRIAPQFGQTASQLRTEVETTFAETDELSLKFPTLFNVIQSDTCPTSRTYICDPDDTSPKGMIVFYAANTDSVRLPAWIIDNFKSPPWNTYFDDALKKLAEESTNDVFIIHGHNEAKWRELKDILVEMGARPVILGEITGYGSASWLDRFIAVAEKCEFAIAIFTEDDVTVNKGKKYFQPRPNVLLEVGWFVAKLSVERIMILSKGSIQFPSDLQGLVYKNFHENVYEVKDHIKKELAAAGIGLSSNLR